jgi:6-phosphogluconolactonase
MRRSPDSSSPKLMLYATVGARLHAFHLELEPPLLRPGPVCMLPEGGQYACADKGRRHLYVLSSNGRPHGVHGDRHFLNAFRIDAATGSLEPWGDAVPLPLRPIHLAVHPVGDFLLIAFPFPGSLMVRRLLADGRIGDEVVQEAPQQWGHVVHQVAFGPGTDPVVLLVTRGNDAKGTAPEDPGALRFFSFRDGQMRALRGIAPNAGYGFGPRNVAVHPGGRWVHLSVERQNRFCVFDGDCGAMSAEPLYVRDTLAHPDDVKPRQYLGPVVCHPRGVASYVVNRADGTEIAGGVEVFNGGENSIVVFAIDSLTGEPAQIQRIDTHGMHAREFGIDPSGQVLIAANSTSRVKLSEGVRERVPAGFALFNIAGDGTLDFVGVHEMDVGDELLFWMAIVALPAGERSQP